MGYLIENCVCYHNMCECPLLNRSGFFICSDDDRFEGIELYNMVIENEAF